MRLVARGRQSNLAGIPGPLSLPPHHFFCPLSHSSDQLGKQQNENENEEDENRLESVDDNMAAPSIETKSTTSSNGVTPFVSATIDPGQLLLGDDVWKASSIEQAWHRLHQHLKRQQTTTTLSKQRGSTNEEEEQSNNNSLDQQNRLMMANDYSALAQVTSRAELAYLFTHVLPGSLSDRIRAHPNFDPDRLQELFIHIGQDVEVRCGHGAGAHMYSVTPPTALELSMLARAIGSFGDDGRAAVSSTLHRCAAWISKSGHIVGVTIRIGRYINGCATALLGAALKGSVLLLSPPAAGKTTLLRDLATQLAARNEGFRVVVVDTCMEIAGEGEMPAVYLSRVRRMQVPKRSAQLHYMLQALQNFSPDYVIIDEIATKEEARAAVSMSQRGIKLIATAHASTLHTLLQNQELSVLVGGTAHAFLSNEERKMRRKVRKTVLERVASSPFRTVVELTSQNSALIVRHVNDCVDMLLDDSSLEKAHPGWTSQVDLQDPTAAVLQHELDEKRTDDVSKELHNSFESSSSSSSSSPAMDECARFSSRELSKSGSDHHRQQDPWAQDRRSSSHATSGRSNNSGNTTVMFCSHCKRRGHTREFCRDLKNQQYQQQQQQLTGTGGDAGSDNTSSSSSSSRGGRKGETIPPEKRQQVGDSSSSSAQEKKVENVAWWERLEEEVTPHVAPDTSINIRSASTSDENNAAPASRVSSFSYPTSPRGGGGGGGGVSAADLAELRRLKEQDAAAARLNSSIDSDGYDVTPLQKGKSKQLWAQRALRLIEQEMTDLNK